MYNLKINTIHYFVSRLRPITITWKRPPLPAPQALAVPQATSQPSTLPMTTVRLLNKRGYTTRNPRKWL